MICEIENSFDSDGTILNAINDSQELDLTENNEKPITSVSTDSEGTTYIFYE